MLYTIQDIAQIIIYTNLCHLLIQDLLVLNEKLHAVPWEFIMHCIQSLMQTFYNPNQAYLFYWLKIVSSFFDMQLMYCLQWTW